MAAQPSSTFGPQLAAWRAGAGLEVDDLAARLRVPAATVVGWEAGRARPGLHAVLNLAETLGFELTDALELLRADRDEHATGEIIRLDLAELQSLLDVADGRTEPAETAHVMASIDARLSAHRD